MHKFFLFFSERTAILRTAKATFQSVTRWRSGHKISKKRIIFTPAISLL
ncbi:hypothetical protein HMPREF0880_01164 [Yokenella regensburgei ATCC 43003]|nr:hypothetical protein HMPREF0880_01164 [Yokenella regensburgei ATCC 43003]